MAHPSRTLRTALHDAIAAQASSPGYSVTTFTLREACVPSANLTDLATPIVTVIALDFDEVLLGRSLLAEGEIPVQFALQAQVDPSDLVACDALLDFQDELRGTAKTLAGYRWLRTEPLKDQNGVPYSYTNLREQNTFEAFATAWFKALIEA